MPRPSRRGERRPLLTTEVSTGVVSGDDIDWPSGVYDGGGVTDHGLLTGLADDDHSQYLKEKASGGLASEIPEHTHAGASEGGDIAVALDDLTDVLITSPTAGQRLRFDGSQWVNSSLVWKPILALDPTTGLYVNVHSSGDPLMAEG